MNFWKTFWACFLAIIISSLISFFFSIFFFVMVVVSMVSAATGLEEASIQTIKKNSVLTIDLSDQIVENLSDNPSDYLNFSNFSFEPPLTLSNTLSALERAAIDPKVKGVYIKVPLVMNTSISMLYELRCAIEKFRIKAPDKFVISYGESYSQGALYLCSAAQKSFINPMGSTLWMGLSANTTFYTNTLKNLGIEAEIIRYGKFKGAVEPFMLTELSPANREQLQSIIDSNWGYLSQVIAGAKDLDLEKLNVVADELGAFTAKGAKEAGLVDDILYADEVEKWVEDEIGTDKVRYVKVGEYAKSKNVSTNIKSDDLVEVIYASGEISDEGLATDGIIGAELAQKLKRAREDDDVKAIVLRVNSPGGSALASEVIWREAELAAQEKPLIVSMGDYAASGGYWISSPATKIMASPLTLTGSIGVFGMSFNVQKGAEEILGLNFDGVTTNSSSDMGSMVRPLSPIERAALQTNVNTIYGKFLDRVSEGRNMTTAEVDSIGQGRVWSGLQAFQNGLVDELGTLSDAIELAAREANIADSYSVYTQKNEKGELLEILLSTGSVMIQSVMPSLFQSSEVVEVIDAVKAKDRRVQARIPLNIEIEY